MHRWNVWCDRNDGSGFLQENISHLTMTSLMTAVAPVLGVFTTRTTNLSEKLPQKHGAPALTIRAL